MHAAAVLALALTLAAPALSAPLPPTGFRFGPGPVKFTPFVGTAVARDFQDVHVLRDILARAAADDQSGASIFSTIAKAIPDVISGVSSLFGGDNNNKREFEDLLVRELLAARDDTQSGASIFTTVLKAIPDVVNGISSLFGGDNNQKREIENILMREVIAARDDTQSGASIFSTIVKAIPTVVNGISSLFGGDNNQKREIEDILMREVLARAAADDQSGASIFSTIAKAIPDVISGVSSLFGGDNNNKRELEDLFVRALVEARSPIITTGVSKIPVHMVRPLSFRELAARDDTTQSGASIFTTVLKAIPDVVNGISSLFGGDNNQKREIEDILMRELISARDDTQSGASIFSTIVKAIPTVVNGISSLFGGDNNQKRDLENLIMREFVARAAAATDDQSGASIFSTIAKAIPDVISGISSLFGGDNNQQKREIENIFMREVVARAAATDDQSGASIFSTIVKAIPDVVNGISSLFGGDNNQKREIEDLIMREVVARAAADDQSGASIFSTIVKAIPDVVNGISSLFGGDNNQKREIESILMREVVARAAADDQSGASIFSTVIKAIPDVVNGISSLFGGDNNNKRDVAELVLRGFFEQVPAVARSLNELD